MMQYNIYTELQLGLLKGTIKKMGRIDIQPLWKHAFQVNMLM